MPPFGRAPVWLGMWLLALWCALAGAQGDTASGLAQAIEAADAAARGFEFEAALQHLEKAIPLAAPEVAARLARRSELYERYLGTPSLVALAKDNPALLVGQGATRGGAQLSGLVRLVELGIVPDARIGNRIPGLGRIALLTGTGEALIPAAQIAQMTMAWTGPEQEAVTGGWTLTRVTVVTRDGGVFEGEPTWQLSMSAFGTRGADDDEDSMVEAYPSFGREFSPDNLLSEIVLVGAPGSAPVVTEPVVAPAPTEPPAPAPEPVTQPTEGTPQ